jgi:hypothetical protein
VGPSLVALQQLMFHLLYSLLPFVNIGLAGLSAAEGGVVSRYAAVQRDLMYNLA